MQKGDSKEIYKQYWELSRHAENERLWFTNIYAIISTGTFVFVGKGLIAETPYIWIFLLFLTVLGFFVTHLTRVDQIIYSRTAQILAMKEFHMPPLYRILYAEDNKDAYFQPWRSTIGSLSFVFHSFYIVMLALFTYILSNAFGVRFNHCLIIAGSVLVIMYLLYFFLFRKKEQEKMAELEEKLSSNAQTASQLSKAP